MREAGDSVAARLAVDTRWHNPVIPPEARGLFAALAAVRPGDSRLLDRWFDVGFPALVTSFTRAWSDANEAEEVAMALVEQAARLVREGAVVHDEAAWVCRVGINEHCSRWRRTKRARRSVEEIREPSSLEDADRFRDSDFVQVRVVLRRLPTPYLEVILWELEGHERAEILIAVQHSSRVGPEGARKIVLRAIERLRDLVDRPGTSGPDR